MNLSSEWQQVGITYLGSSYGDMYICADAKYDQMDIYNNRTHVCYRARVYYTGSYITDGYGTSYACSGGGTGSGWSYFTSGNILCEGSNWVQHNADGTKSHSASAYLNMPGWGWSGTASGTFDIPSYDRSAPSISQSGITNVGTSSFTVSASSNVSCDTWQYSLNGGSSWTTFRSDSATSVSHTITGLSINTAYTVQIRARKVSNYVWGSSGSQSATTLGNSSISSASNVTIGNNCSVSWTPYSSSFKFSLTFSLGNWSHTINNIQPGTTSSYTYTGYSIPMEVCNRITTATSGTMTVTLTTYTSGGSQVGPSSSSSFVVSVPSSVVPSITTATVTAYNANTTIRSIWGNIWVAGYTQADSSATASGSYGSTISSIVLTGADSYTSQSSSLSHRSEVQTAGPKTFTFTATDSRGRTVSQTVTISVNDYQPPAISSFAFNRINNNVTKVSVTGTWTITNLGTNTSTANVRYKLTSASTYSTSSTHPTSGTAATLAETFASGSSYRMILDVTDSLGNTTSTAIGFLPTITVTIDYPTGVIGGQGLGIGKVCESAKLEVGYDTEFFEDVTFDGDASITGDTTMSGNLSVSGGIVNLGNKVGINENNPSYTLDVQSPSAVTDATFRLGDVDYTITDSEYASLATSLASAFSTSVTYWVGQFVIYSGHTYECNTQHSGNWNASHFTLLS